MFPLDPNERFDLDEDGIGDQSDNCQVISNPSQTDTDNDSIGDACDRDDDDDGVLDDEDAFPLDPSESVDTDSDNIGNNADDDDDGDGVQDTDDAFPLDFSEFKEQMAMESVTMPIMIVTVTALKMTTMRSPWMALSPVILIQTASVTTRIPMTMGTVPIATTRSR